MKDTPPTIRCDDCFGSGFFDTLGPLRKGKDREAIASHIDNCRECRKTIRNYFETYLFFEEIFSGTVESPRYEVVGDEDEVWEKVKTNFGLAG